MWNVIHISNRIPAILVGKSDANIRFDDLRDREFGDPIPEPKGERLMFA